MNKESCDLSDPFVVMLLPKRRKRKYISIQKSNFSLKKKCG